MVHHRTSYDDYFPMVSAKYSFTKNLQFHTGFNDGQTWMTTPTANAEGQGAAVRVYENYGANWNLGVKGTF